VQSPRCAQWSFSLGTDAIIRDSGMADPIDLNAQQHQVQHLPAEFASSFGRSVGRTPHPRRIAQAGHRGWAEHGGKAHGAAAAATLTRLEDLPLQSRRRHCLDGPLCGADDFVSVVVWIADPAARTPGAALVRGHRPSRLRNGLYCSSLRRLAGGMHRNTSSVIGIASTAPGLFSACGPWASGIDR
jgi:hypothetical protein